jgi:hypothetical protein
MPHSGSASKNHRLRKMPQGIPARRTITEYLRSNVFLTTSGNFRTPTLVNAIAEVGADRVLFSVDYPFEETADAAEWFDSAPIPESNRCTSASETPRCCSGCSFVLDVVSRSVLARDSGIPVEEDRDWRRLGNDLADQEALPVR